MLEVQNVNSIPSNRECLTRSVNGKTVVNNRSTYQRAYLLVSIRIDFFVCIYWLEFISSNFELQRSERKKTTVYLYRTSTWRRRMYHELLIVTKWTRATKLCSEVNSPRSYNSQCIRIWCCCIRYCIDCWTEFGTFSKNDAYTAPGFWIFSHDSRIGIKDRIPNNY